MYSIAIYKNKVNYMNVKRSKKGVSIIDYGIRKYDDLNKVLNKSFTDIMKSEKSTDKYISCVVDSQLCSFNEIIDKKRGKFHYDSSVYPYVCTAVIKGKWNFKEYKKELYEIFYDKNFNIFSYYLTKLKF